MWLALIPFMPAAAAASGQRLARSGEASAAKAVCRPSGGHRLRFVRTVFAACILAVLSGCGPDPVGKMQGLPAPLAPGLTLKDILGKYPHFAKVTWSSYPGQQGRVMARATGIYNLDTLVGKSSGGREFTEKDKAAIGKSAASLCYILEYAFGKDAPDGTRTQQAVSIVSINWDKTANLADEAILSEITQGLAGEATLKAALDAADYCRSLPSSSPGKRQ